MSETFYSFISSIDDLFQHNHTILNQYSSRSHSRLGILHKIYLVGYDMSMQWWLGVNAVLQIRHICTLLNVVLCNPVEIKYSCQDSSSHAFL
jgi:hypothetical protein